MSGREILGSRCLLPAELVAMTEDQKKKSLTLIATMYPELEKKLREQCRAMGLPEARILIV
jgi:hypothetical protein